MVPPTASQGSVLMYVGIWYTTASLSNNVSKMLLKQFPYPLTVSLIELLVAVTIMVLSTPTATMQTLRRFKHIWRWGLLLGGVSLSNLVLHRMSLMYLHVSFVHTIKASQPLFAVLLSRLWLREQLHSGVLPPLAMIFAGVGLASFAEADFDLVGSLAALGATACLATNTMLSKIAMSSLELNNVTLIALVKSCSFLLLIPVWIFNDLSRA